MASKTFSLFTDGACRGNPGCGGAGAVLMAEDGQVVATAKRFLGHCTNNIAEYRALILGLAVQGGAVFSEELDWCKRAKLAGWQIVYVGSARITVYFHRFVDRRALKLN